MIVFKKTTGAGSPSGGTDVLASIHDYLLWYAKDRRSVKYRQLYLQKLDESGQYSWVEKANGTRLKASETSMEAGDRAFRVSDLTSQTAGQTTIFEVSVDGKTFHPKKGGWKTNRDGMDRLIAASRVWASGKTLGYVRFYDDFPVSPRSNLWEDTVTSGFGDPKVYVVQTNSRIVERCMLMCYGPRRSGFRSHMRIWDDRICCGALGAPLDHHRHLPRRNCAARGSG